MTKFLSLKRFGADFCNINNSKKMTTKIEDEQLETELQELYLTGKQWLSDADFIQDEELFLTGLIKDMPAEVQEIFQPLIDDVRTANEKLRSEVLAFMWTLETLIIRKEAKLDRTLIDNFVILQQSVTDILEKLKLLKYRVVQLQRAA